METNCHGWDINKKDSEAFMALIVFGFG